MTGDEHLVAVADDGEFAVLHPAHRVAGARCPQPCTLEARLRVCGARPGIYVATPDTGPASLPGWRLERT